MKDKILPLDYDQYSVEELTEKANKIIESLEKENDLNNSVDSCLLYTSPSPRD